MIWRSWNVLKGASNSFQRAWETRILFLLGTTLGGSCGFLASASHAKLSRPPLYFSATRSRGFLSILATSASNDHPNPLPRRIARSQTQSLRTHSTGVDQYYHTHHQIPLPPILHDSIDRLLSNDVRPDSESSTPSTSQKILVVGDVHGCLNELRSLIAKARMEHNGGKRFAAVVLVGDLCNKGPDSAEVIQFVRKERGCFSVRGNHDNSGLVAAIRAGMDEERDRLKAKYDWVKKLTDEDVAWLSNLPYTISIPRKWRMDSENDSKQKADVLVVHAGFIPNLRLTEQSVRTMTTVRNVIESSKTEDSNADGNEKKTYEYHDTKNDNGTQNRDTLKAWAQTWEGPELVIFGHDAKRGLQQEKHAIGLDTGACYGKRLTGIVLPEDVLVSVDAEKIHCPIK